MENSLMRAKQIAGELEKKGAEDILVIDVGDRTIISDYFVICSGRSNVQVKALCDNIEELLAKEGISPRRKEGYEHGRWIVLDYIYILVHIFHREEREFYNIERLWADAQNTIDFKQDAADA